jgi:hypothetical protein
MYAAGLTGAAVFIGASGAGALQIPHRCLALGKPIRLAKQIPFG